VTWANLLKIIVKGKAGEDRAAGRPSSSQANDDMESISSLIAEKRARHKNIGYFSEKRRFRRYRDGQKAICYTHMSHPIEIKVLDASLGGLRLKTDSMIRVESDIGILLNFKGESAHFMVKVLWEARDNGAYQYGVNFARFDQEKNTQVMQYLAGLK